MSDWYFFSVDESYPSSYPLIPWNRDNFVTRGHKAMGVVESSGFIHVSVSEHKSKVVTVDFQG